jgi:hypothetical protein
MKGESKTEYIQIYKDLTSDPQTPTEVLKTLAAGLHEILALIPYENGALGSMEEIVKFFLTSSNKAVREQISKNIDKII